MNSIQSTYITFGIFAFFVVYFMVQSVTLYNIEKLILDEKQRRKRIIVRLAISAVILGTILVVFFITNSPFVLFSLLIIFGFLSIPYEIYKNVKLTNTIQRNLKDKSSRA